MAERTGAKGPADKLAAKLPPESAIERKQLLEKKSLEWHGSMRVLRAQLMALQRLSGLIPWQLSGPVQVPQKV